MSDEHDELYNRLREVLGEDAFNPNQVELSLNATKVNVALANDPNTEYWVPTLIFEVSDAVVGTVAIVIPDYDTNLRMTQELLTLFMDSQGMDELKEVFIRNSRRMVLDDKALPVMIQMANDAAENGFADPQLRMRTMKRPTDD